MSASSPLPLDPTDPTDKQIIARQVKAARQAGRERRDRARATRGRPDLEAAYDEGAADEDDVDQDDEDDVDDVPASAPSTSARGNWSAFKPRSPARPPRRLADAGGFATGLLLYTVVIVYVRYGPAGWKGWLSAKFLNKPMSATAAKTSAAGSGSTEVPA